MRFNRIGAIFTFAIVLRLCTFVSAATITIKTNDGIGADAEVREEQPTTNRGTNNELGTRVGISPPAINNVQAHMYTKFDVSTLPVDALTGPITFRMTLRNSNLTTSRVTDTTNNAGNTGLVYYVLDPSNPGANWGETTIVYNNAPGLAPDGNTATKDFVVGAGNLAALGAHPYRSLNNENHLPVGEAFDFTMAPGSPLHAAIAAAMGSSNPAVTLVSTIQHPANYANPAVHSNWLSFSYLFNPKEQITLNNDNNYDNDVSAADGNEGSPYSCQPAGTNTCPGGTILGDNSSGAFSPQLIFNYEIIPEPSSFVLMLLGLFVGPVRVRRSGS